MEEIRTIIVDDDPVCIEDLMDLLIDHPKVKVLSTYTDPLLAVKEIQNVQIDLLFLDIEMPGISGLNLVDYIKEIHHGISIIFVTAYNKYAIQAIKKAAFDYLLKPLDLDELSTTLNRLKNAKGPGEMQLSQLRSKYGLSKRETEITSLVKGGLTSDQIAVQLNISIFTVNTHRQNILRKTGCKNFHEVIGK